MAEPYTIFTWGNPPFRVDILTHIPGVAFEDAWSRRVTVTVNRKNGLQAPFISAEDFIANKTKASEDDPSRLYDRADAEDVRRTRERRGEQQDDAPNPDKPTSRYRRSHRR